MKDKKATLYEAIQTEVMADILIHSDMNFFRKVCRWYSTTFHTPLHIVMECVTIQWDEILLHYYESRLEDIGYNQVYEIAVKDFIPELAEEYEEDNREFAKSLVAEQKRTLAKQKARNKTAEVSKSDTSKVNEKPPAPMKLSFDDDI